MSRRVIAVCAGTGLLVAWLVVGPAWARLAPRVAAQAKMPQQMQMMKPDPNVGKALQSLVKAKQELGAKQAYQCCIKPGCNFCALAADKCPCGNNVKTPMGVCGECKAGWEAGVGNVDGVKAEDVKLIQGDMLKMMYSMRGPREQMAGGKK